MTIVTAIFGEYEELKEPTVITPGWKYICYTDQPLKSDVWEIHRFQDIGVSPVMDARFWKIKHIPKGKSMWVDGSFTINVDLNEWWNKHFVTPFTVIQHPMRNCIYAEATACIGNKRANDTEIRRQADQYRKEKVPINAGVIQSGILMREDTPEVREFCNLWYEQLQLSTRDQIGFAYAEWKLGVKWPRIQWDYRKGQEFIFLTHYNRRSNVHKAYRSH